MTSVLSLFILFMRIEFCFEQVLVMVVSFASCSGNVAAKTHIPIDLFTNLVNTGQTGESNYFFIRLLNCYVVRTVPFYFYSVSNLFVGNGSASAASRARRFLVDTLYIPEQRCSSHWYQHQANKSLE